MKDQWEHAIKHWQEISLTSGSEASYTLLRRDTRLTFFPIEPHRLNTILGSTNIEAVREALDTTKLLQQHNPAAHFVPKSSDALDVHSVRELISSYIVDNHSLRRDNLAKLTDEDFNLTLHWIQQQVFSGKYPFEHERDEESTEKTQLRPWPAGKKTEPYEV
jgi:hypothetical protein